MTAPKHIFIDDEQATLRSYSAKNGRGEITVLTLELEIRSPDALAYILRQVAEFKAPPPKPKKGRSDAD